MATEVKGFSDHLAGFMRHLKLAIATQGKRVNLPGGLPIVVDGHLVGGIGVGSGAGHEDLEVANAGLAAIPGTKRFDG